MGERRLCAGAGVLVLLAVLTGRTADGACEIPEALKGDWYSLEQGQDVFTLVAGQQWGDTQCEDVKQHANPHSAPGLNATLLLRSPGCWRCLDVIWRTPNILQYRKSDCYTKNYGIEVMCPGYQQLPSPYLLTTLFRQTVKTVDCKSTLDGIYQFSYEVSWGGGGVCNSSGSEVKACQEPGSPYVDNEVFVMTYARCPDVMTSRSHAVRYHCMGSWSAMLGGTYYTFAAVADFRARDSRERFKCLMTRKDQRFEDGSERWVMSRFGDCGSLHSLYDAPVRLLLRRKELSCELPVQGTRDPAQVIVG